MSNHGHCIFCGQHSKLTKEHFWPNWLRKHLPTDSSDSYFTEIHSTNSLAPPTLQNRKVFQGDVTTKKIRAVCGSCNNGWMSRLEERVKPLLMSLMNDTAPHLTTRQVYEVSLWCSVKAVTAEYTNKNEALTPSADRYQIRATGAIPKYIRIFLGTHAGLNFAAYKRQSLTACPANTMKIFVLEKDLHRNIHAITFLLGRLVFHIVSARVAGFDVSRLDPAENMHQLWPQGDAVDLLHLKTLNSGELFNVAARLEQVISQSAIAHAGDIPRIVESENKNDRGEPT